MRTVVLWILILNSFACAFKVRKNAIDQPSLSFEDVGACPFEGCVYRDWIAMSNTDIYKERSTSSPVLFYVRKFELSDSCNSARGSTLPAYLSGRRFLEGMVQKSDG